MSPAEILVVDDCEINRDLLARRLAARGHHVVCASDGREAIDTLHNGHRFDLVLLDILMPGVNGYQVLQHMKADSGLRYIPLIVISAVDTMESVVKCIKGGADDYLTKPCNPVLLEARVNACLEKKRLHDHEEHQRQQLQQYSRTLEQRIQEQVDKISSSQLTTIFAMSKLAESKDEETGAHLERMREYCRILAERLAETEPYKEAINQSFINCIYAASPLHDIGKVGIPDHVLLKRGRLDAQEWEVMKTHPVIGAETLRAVDEQHPGNAFVEMGIQIAECHHEKWDGSGYPYGLKGKEIPLAARILALADVYDALTSARCYKDAFSHDKSRAIILESSGSHFDPAIVRAFSEREEEFVLVKSCFKDSE